jgi:hypothetical protein
MAEPSMSGARALLLDPDVLVEADDLLVQRGRQASHAHPRLRHLELGAWRAAPRLEAAASQAPVHFISAGKAMLVSQRRISNIMLARHLPSSQPARGRSV